MRILTFLEYSAVLIGVIAMIAGGFFDIRDGLHLGIFLVGAGIALGGLESLATQRPGFALSERSRDVYLGLPSLVWGVMLLLAGTTVIWLAYVLNAGQWHVTVDALMRRPGPLLAGAGLFAICTGILFTLNPRGRRGAWWTLLVRMPKALFGFALVISGLAAVGLGAWEWLEPAAYAQFSKNLQAQFDPAAIGRFWKDLSR
ncbi:MAG: hypothetical protein KIT18_01365 [Burkholderiales bacterium]|nr:hypothetical protein [Burkholderiales bacterium]